MKEQLLCRGRKLGSNKEWEEGYFVKYQRNSMVEEFVCGKELNKQCLLKAYWKDGLQGIPIDAFLQGDKLIKNLSNGIYTCEAWLNQNYHFVSFRSGLNVFQCYQMMYPNLHSSYAYLLASAVLTKKEIQDVDAVNFFLKNLPFRNAEDMKVRIEQILICDPICLECVQLRYGVTTHCVMTVEDIMHKLNLTKSQVDNKIKKAKRIVKKSNILKQLEEDDDTIKKLQLSTRASNCLLRNHILTISQLEKLTQPELFNMKNMGIKTVKEISYKMSMYQKTEVNKTYTK